MAVAVDLELTPSLEEVRELARDHSLVPLRHTFIADCETPVSAYLKLRGEGPSFLLESAEQGQQVGRWSFLGFRPRAVIRLGTAHEVISEHADGATGERRQPLERGDPVVSQLLRNRRIRVGVLAALEADHRTRSDPEERPAAHLLALLGRLEQERRSVAA